MRLTEECGRVAVHGLRWIGVWAPRRARLPEQNRRTQPNWRWHSQRRVVWTFLLVLSTMAATAMGKPRKPDPPSQAPLGNDFPTAERPWEGDVLGARREQYKQTIQSLMAVPAEQVKAHPAAADFPGLPPASAEPITRNGHVNTAVHRWHSTGLYAPPGKLITVTVPAEAAVAKLEVRIGCHTDTLWRDTITRWKRVPEISRAFKITGPVTHAANAFGGLIYIVVPHNAPPANLKVTVTGGIPAPYYVLGQTSLEQWRESLRNQPAPWAELECKGLIFSIPSVTIRQLDDPEPVMKFWRQVIDAEDDLAGKVGRTDPERMVFDRQISVGYMHSGYPAMAPLGAAAKVVENLVELKKGNWGVFHEMGHNHQNPAWTFDGTVEVTVNLFSMYCNEKVCGIPRSAGHDLQSPKQQAKVQQYLAGGKFEDWKHDPFLALCMYDQLVEVFGWEPFKKVFVEYRDASKAQLPKNDDQKRDQWLVRFSRTVGRNLGPFFEAWKVPTSQSARDSIRDLPRWMPGSEAPSGAGRGRTTSQRARG